MSGTNEQSDYSKYRGKCKQFCEELLAKNPKLTLIRGYYHCAYWGKQPHWWCEDQDGNIIDPTIKQFPDKNGEYEKFSGIFNCSNCGVETEESKSTIYGNYIFCSGECLIKFIL
jgi:hypothetical protein